MNRSIIVSGATGSIGIALTNYLVSIGKKVTLILRPNSKRNNFFQNNNNFDIFYCELSNYNKLFIPGKHDVFFHFAWEGGKSRNDLDTNLKSAQHTGDAVLLALKLGCRAFIGAGSQAECGPQTIPISSELICNPVNFFGLGKLSALHLTKILCYQNDLRFCWLRILSVYGPYDGEQTMITSTINKILSGSNLSFTHGEQKWDFLYSEDAAEIIGKIGLDDNAHGIYVIGSGFSRKLKEYISILTNQFEIDEKPYLGLISSDKNDTLFLEADTSRIKKEFNWVPKIDFETGIQKTIDFLKDNNKNQ